MQDVLPAFSLQVLKGEAQLGTPPCIAKIQLAVRWTAPDLLRNRIDNELELARMRRLNHCDHIARFVRCAPEKCDRAVHPDNLAVIPPIASVDKESLALACQQLVDNRLIGRGVRFVSDLRDGHAPQMLLRVTNQPGKRRIDSDYVPRKIKDSHAGGGLLQNPPPQGLAASCLH